MGYYTHYSMDARNLNEKEFDALIDACKERQIVASDTNKYGVFDNYSYDISDNSVVFESYEACKWYEHDKDMIEISSMFPNAVFCLHGEGEESDDLWNTYYSNGEYETCCAHIIYDELKTIKW
jgi:hypothetical protein